MNLYPLADILQMGLEVYSEGIRGSVTVEVLGAPVKFTMEVVSSYSDEGVVGI